MIERIFNVPGLNVYITLLGIIISVGTHLAFARKTTRQKKIEIVLMHSIGISAFMSIVSFIGACILCRHSGKLYWMAHGKPIKDI